MSYQFIDTNVLVYAYDEAVGEKQHRATELVSRLADARQAAASIQVLQEYYVTVTRKIERPLSPEKAREVVAAFARWRVHSPLAADVLLAIDVSVDNKISFWDAMILTSAFRLGCKTLWSEDLNPGQQILGVTVKNPFAEA